MSEENKWTADPYVDQLNRKLKAAMKTMTTPSDTPRSNEADSQWEKSESVVDAFNGAIDLCRQLERELAAANAKIKALVEAGDYMAERCSLWTISSGNFLCDEDRESVNAWTAAKEGAK